MSSGIGVADEVKELFNKMKVVKHEDDHMERIRMMVCRINDKFIEVETVYREKDLQGKNVFDVFKSLLVTGQCRYILYDCHFESKECSKKEELVFVLWCPDSATVKDKMKYASSATAIRQATKGAKHDLEVHDLSDCATKACFAEHLEKGILSVEGYPCDAASTAHSH